MTEQKLQNIQNSLLIRTHMYHGWASRRPVLLLLGGLAVAAAIAATGWWIYRDLVDWERAGNPERLIDSFTYVLYKVGGPRLALGAMLATAAGVAFASARGFVRNANVARRGRSGAPPPPMPHASRTDGSQRV